MDLILLNEALAARGEPAFRARQVWEWAARGVAGYDEMTNLPRALRDELADAVPFSTLSVEDEARVRGRHREGALPHRRRASGRGGADALSRRPPLDLRLVAVGLPAHVHVLRDGRDEVRPQPEGVRDPRPGAALPAARAGEPPRLHGDGRAVSQLRRGVRGGAAAARRRDHAPPHDDLDRRLDARPAALRRRGRAADPAGALDPRRRPAAALGADARQRPLPAPRGAGRVPPLLRAAAAEGVRRVRDARRRQRLARAREGAGRAARSRRSSR